MNEPNCIACSEYNKLSRRQFMAVSGGAALATSLPAWLPRVAYAQDYCSNRDVIVTIFQRGACDAFTLCVPHADGAYYAARPNLAVPPPDSTNPLKAIDLDGYFGFPQSMASLVPAFSAGHLLVVHACGTPDTTRSHFDTQRFMEVGGGYNLNLFTGWLGRHLASVPPKSPGSILRGVAIAYGLPMLITGAPDTLPIPDPFNFGIGGSSFTLPERRAVLTDLYASAGDPFQAAAATALQTIDLLDSIGFAGYQPAGGAVYPNNSFAQSLKATAALIKADVGVEAVSLDIGGWDTHGGQGLGGGGYLGNLITTLATALAAFHADLFAGNGHNVTTVVMSEFGRRLQENGSSGTDHGHGGAMLVMGPNISGGRVLTQWPGLAPGQLFEGRDLAVTIDFRDVIGEIVHHRLGNPNLNQIFPDYTPQFRGVTSDCGLGDLNCDGATDLADVDPFVQAVTDPSGVASANPSCNVTGADVNRDGMIDARDVQSFTDKLLKP